LTLFDFLVAASVAWQTWLPEGLLREEYRREAMRRWFQSDSHENLRKNPEN
jgi:hypothetical protein